MPNKARCANLLLLRLGITKSCSEKLQRVKRSDKASSSREPDALI